VLSVEVAEEALASADNAGAESALAEAEVTAALAALKDAEAQLGLDRVLLAQHVLTAPYDALVITRHKELGTALPAGEPVFSLVDPCTVWVRAFVDETKAGHLAVGQIAEVRLRSWPGKSFPGQVARIEIESDRVGEERRVNVTWEACPQGFHLGEQAEVVITTGRLEGAILLPQTVVQGFDGTGGEIWTLEDGRLNRRRVVLGQGTLDGRLPVIKGLPPGAQVLAALPGGLRLGRGATAQADGQP
jgi:HlyD family secretion protein